VRSVSDRDQPADRESVLATTLNRALVTGENCTVMGRSSVRLHHGGRSHMEGAGLCTSGARGCCWDTTWTKAWPRWSCPDARG